LARDETSLTVIGHLFSRLVELTADLDILPDVAQNWRVSGGGQRYTFHLRDDVVWTDGVPVTARDYAFAWQRQLDPANTSPMVADLFDVAGARAYHQGQASLEDVGIRAVDDRTLVLEMEEPTGYVLYLVANPHLSPVPYHVVEERGSAWTHGGELVSNGPYRLASRISGERMVLERNPAFHGQHVGNADCVELLYSAFGPSTAGLELYEREGLDVLPLRLPAADRDRVRWRYATEIVVAQSPAILYLAMHPHHPPFDDRRVRRALALGTNREQLVRRSADIDLVFYDGGVVPPGMPGHSPGIALPYDPEQARCLLSEAGYRHGAGFPATSVLSLSWAVPLLDALAGLWREELGIPVEPEVTDVASFAERTERELAPMFVTGWMPHYPDPNTYLRGGVQRITRLWRNERYEALVDQAGRCADQAQRMALCGQADRMLIEEAVVVPLGPRKTQLLIKPWVSRYPLTTIRVPYWSYVVIEPH
jgi:oligopeptide transport system substrate-binding protein